MSRRKMPNKEGDWFAMPLTCGGYALGLVARTAGTAVLAYFFAPRYESVPSVEDAIGKEPSGAIAVAQVGALGLTKGTWKIVGRLEPWERSQWPIPAFSDYHELTGTSWRVVYQEDLHGIGRRESASAEEIRSLPKDGLWGYLFAEQRISSLLCEERGRQPDEGPLGERKAGPLRPDPT